MFTVQLGLYFEYLVLKLVEIIPPELRESIPDSRIHEQLEGNLWLRSGKVSIPDVAREVYSRIGKQLLAAFAFFISVVLFDKLSVIIK